MENKSQNLYSVVIRQCSASTAQYEIPDSNIIYTLTYFDHISSQFLIY